MARTEYIGEIPFTTTVPLMRAWTEKAADGTDVRKVEMIASSTRVDAYRDRMSGNALAEMAAQATGKDFLPEHRAEWHDLLGTVVDGKATDTLFTATAVLDPSSVRAEEKADSLFKLVTKGKRIGVSIAGFIRRVMFEEDETGREVRVIDSIRLDHIAVTRSPANEDAFIIGISKSLDAALSGTWDVPEGLSKTVVPFTTHPTAPEATAWSFSAEDGNALIEKGGWAFYRSAHSWYDANAPEVKASYKLPHHKLIGGTLTTVWRGVAAAMAALLGGGGGVQIPASERKGTFQHLSKEYALYGKPVPDFKAVEAWWSLRDSASEVHDSQALPSAFSSLFRAGELDADALTEEDVPMDKTELQAVLTEAQTTASASLAETLKSTLTESFTPLAASLGLIGETLKVLAASQGQVTEALAQSQAAVASIKETMETKVSRGAKGRVTFRTDPAADPGESDTDGAETPQAHPFDEIARDHQFTSWAEFTRKAPHVALRALADISTVPGRRNRVAFSLLDWMREDGGSSPHEGHDPGWQSRPEAAAS